ncbi:lysozyme inhibitor LprI family protein [Cupriavidus pauculus]|nr:lysozyme inhibitor LprI family protein [Cupriavidus pauculus]
MTQTNKKIVSRTRPDAVSWVPSVFQSGPVRMLLATVLLGASLAGCSSKPGSDDLERELVHAYRCPLLDVADVKKVDGASDGNNAYQIAYSFRLELKGGKDAAAKLLPEWSSLSKQERAAKIELEQAVMAAAFAGVGSGKVSDAAVQAVQRRDDAQARREQVAARIKQILPCETPGAQLALSSLLGEAEAQMNADARQAAMPIGLKAKGAGMMTKGESSWHFAGDVPPFGVEEVIVSEPVVYAAPSQAVPAAPAQKPVPVAHAKSDDVGRAGMPTIPASDKEKQPQAETTSRGPSFDCDRASTRIEKIICADAKLSSLDAVMVDAYKAAIARTSDKDALKKQQSDWRHKVRDACGDDACLSSAYQQRISSLR